MKAPMDVQFFAADPFGDAFLEALRQDLDGAAWVRFLVCYFNRDGHKALSPLLGQALQHPLSRGLATLTCACGMEGLEALWEEAEHPQDKLRCFVPLKKDGPADAKLLHSKIAVIVKAGATPRRPQRVVLYTGSHNWTGPGLRVPKKGRGRLNVEASVRLEMDWEPAWLDQVSSEPASPSTNPVVDALNQLERCFFLESSTDLSDHGARHEIESWLRDQCKEGLAAPGSTTFIVASAVLSGEVDGETAQSGVRMPRGSPVKLPHTGDGLFVQHFNYQGAEPETFDSASAWAVLMWERSGDLRKARQPWLVLCRARNLGQQDAGSPDLQSVQWLVYDPRHNSRAAPATNGQTDHPPETVSVPGHVLPTQTPLDVEVWRMAPVKPGTSTQELNHHTPSRYALLEVVAVRSPVDRVDQSVARPWQGTEMPFHVGKQRRARRGFVVHERNGEPSERRARAMREEQRELFGLSVPTDAGPTGDGELLDRDFFPCIAPINEVLFAGRNARGREAFVPGRERAAHFEVPSDPEVSRSRSKRVARMEKLMAPGTPHVADALGLGYVDLSKLGLKK